MKKMLLIAITAFGIVMSGTTAIAKESISSLRGDHDLDGSALKAAKMKQKSQKGGFDRSYKQQPPMIPHKTDKDVIKRVKKENIDLLREVSHLKIQNQELEIEHQKYIRKDKMLRDDITEMKISFEEMQHRFETRIAEYKQQLHLRDERMNSLKDNIRFQRKMISEQDQALAIAESREGKKDITIHRLL